MSLIFYPRDIGMWRKEFDFAHNSTLIPKEKMDHKEFYDFDELTGWLKQHGVRLDDPTYPLTITRSNGTGIHHVFGQDVYDVVQWSLIGWVKGSVQCATTKRKKNGKKENRIYC